MVDVVVGAALSILRAAANKGERCPTNDELRRQLYELGHTLSSDAHPAELAYEGLIKVEVYGRNYRVIEIEGKRTAEAPPGWEPYLVIAGKET